MIICIERECGSGGHVVAARLARIYDLPLYDRQNLIVRAKEKGLYEELKRFFEEQPSESLLYSVAKNNEIPEFGRETYAKLKSLIEEPDFILIGRCGNYIYRKDENLVSVFLHAEVRDRIKRTMKKQHLDRWNAGKLVDEVDDKRRKFHKYYSGRTWGMAADYDICLNTSYTGIDGAVYLVQEYIEGKFGAR